MSGHPGGRTMTLDPRTAQDWIDRGWAEAIVEPAESEPKKRKPPKPYSRHVPSTTMDMGSGLEGDR